MPDSNTTIESVSVVMCTYNGKQFITEQLSSIISQTYPIAELLIFDDCSTDGTWQIVEQYGKKYPFITAVKNETNMGYARNFKQAILAAKGNIVATADQDDVWHTHKLEKLIKNWSSTALLVYCDFVRFTTELPKSPQPNRRYRRFAGEDAPRLFFFNTVSGHAMLFKRQLISLAFPFANDIYYDWWFAVVAACNGGVDYVAETLVFQRLHSANITGNNLEHTTVAGKQKYLAMVMRHLQQFASLTAMQPGHAKLANKLQKALHCRQKTRFYLPLFWLIVQHYRVLFNYKAKSNVVSLFKHAVRLTYNAHPQL